MSKTPRENLALMLPLGPPTDANAIAAAIGVSRPRVYQILGELRVQRVWVRPEDLNLAARLKIFGMSDEEIAKI